MARWTTIRDIALFAAGLFGVAHETFSENAERPQLLLLYAGMMGLPAFFRRNGKNGSA